jgi:hypothetical protein
MGSAPGRVRFDTPRRRSWLPVYHPCIRTRAFRGIVARFQGEAGRAGQGQEGQEKPIKK